MVLWDMERKAKELILVHDVNQNIHSLEEEGTRMNY
jgi:hypothetical protein